MIDALRAFAQDDQLHLALVLIALDLILGVGAAFKVGSFRLSYFADFAKTDLLGKVFPWFVLFAFGFASPAADIGGLSIEDIADGAWIAVVAALVGSITSSLAVFGVPLPAALGAGEKPPPGP